MSAGGGYYGPGRAGNAAAGYGGTGGYGGGAAGGGGGGYGELLTDSPRIPDLIDHMPLYCMHILDLLGCLLHVFMRHCS